MAIRRRDFLRMTGVWAGSAAMGFLRLQDLAAAGATAPHRRIEGTRADYGPLRQVGPDLALPEGFQYRRFGEAGTPMSDGRLTPLEHDGMAAFPLPNGNIRLVRNHEMAGRAPTQPVLANTYDPVAGGGTTSLEVDPVSRELVSSFVSLDGTVRNCAGGPTPWGSWLSCEETTFGVGRGLERPHGYVFEVPVSAEEPVEPVPITALGRFVHEAVAVDPNTGVVYLTEDQRPGGFYRFIPADPYQPGRPISWGDGGRLQLLRVRGRRSANLHRGQEVGRVMDVRWVDVHDPDPGDAEANPAAVFTQGRDQGAAAFSRCEGCWFGDGTVYFTCTDGGDALQGQVWGYRPGVDDEDGGTLTLLFESPDAGVLSQPDNVCVSPRGAVLLCEDGRPPNLIRALTPEGHIFDFVENVGNGSEIAGATFSPDGETLFFNVQNDPGATYAVWGPWEEGGI